MVSGPDVFREQDEKNLLKTTSSSNRQKSLFFLEKKWSTLDCQKLTIFQLFDANKKLLSFDPLKKGEKSPNSQM